MNHIPTTQAGPIWAATIAGAPCCKQVAGKPLKSGKTDFALDKKPIKYIIKPMLTDIEKKVVASLQGNIPVNERPFLALADAIGISEQEYLDIVSRLNDQGIIRRFGATIKHQKSGFKANAMVAWNVAEPQARKAGKIMASFQEVTHCYRRDPAPTWPYNLYTMVHGPDEATCHAIAEKISKAVNVTDYTLLFSRKELKKTSMQYFD